MFRWNLMLRTLFGLRGEQPKARRPKPTAKPNLEVLEDRTLPSASAQSVVTVASPPPAPQSVVSEASPPAEPQMTALTSYLVAAMNQESQLLTTVQQDAVSVLTTLDQAIVQAWSYVLEQVGPLFGINPNTPNPGLNTAVSQPGSDSGIGMGRGNSSGSGSGSSAMTTGNAPNQALNIGTQQSGSGSGSGTMTTDHGNAPTQGVKTVSPLTGSGSVTYTWDPGAGNSTGTGTGSGKPTNYNASNYKNWLKNGQPQSGSSGTVPGSQPTDIAMFESGSGTPNPYNQTIVWDQVFKFSTMKVYAGYNSKETINSGVTVELTGQDGSSLSMDGSSTLYLYFGNGGAVFQVDNNATITNMNLTGYPNGYFQIQGGTTTIAQSSAYTETTGVSIVIASGATLNDQSNTSLKFTNDGLYIHVDGTMDTYYGPGTGIKLIDSGGNADDYIDVDYGTLYYGGASGVTDTFTVPVLVEYIGTFKLGAAKGQTACGTLIVQGANASTNNASVYLTGQGSSPQNSSVQLSSNATLECDSNYYQDNGTLITMDATKCTLQDGSGGAGTATIAGGQVLVDNLSNSYGELDVKAANLQFGGTLNVSILGYNPGVTQGNQDVLKVVNGNFNLNPQGSTSLYVGVYGTVVGGDTWTIIYSNNITSSTNTINFASMTTNPQTNLNGTANPPGKQGQYLLSF